MNQKAQAILDRLPPMISRRSTWNTHWQEIIDYVMPDRSPITHEGTPGAKRTGKIYDDTAGDALDLAAAGLSGKMTNEAMPWFEIGTQDPDLEAIDEVAAWCDDATQTMHDALHDSNFYLEIFTVYQDILGFGTACLYTEAGLIKDLSFQARAVGECYFAENKDGIIDTNYRPFKYTARQIEQEWPGKASGDVREALKDSPDKEFEILHAVFPRTDREAMKIDSRNKPWASVYLETKSGNILEEEGYDEFPYAVPRFKKRSREIYGHSPAMRALPDIKMLNQMCRTSLRGAQKAVDPPVQAPNEGYILPLRTGPGGANYNANWAKQGSDIKAIDAKSDVRLGLEMENQRREAIKNKFYWNLWLLPESPQKTATEILERIDQSTKILGPILGRITRELLVPTVNRVFNILFRNGRFRTLPEALARYAGDDILKIRFISPIAKAQKLYQAQAVNNAMMFLGPVADRYPEILDRFNPDELADLAIDLFGVPTRVLRTDDRVEAIREARRKRSLGDAARSQMAENIAAAKMASETDPGKGLLAAMQVEGSA
jgi:hypothetical protein